MTVFDMVHELFPSCFPPDDPTPERKSAAIARADHVICASESTRRDLLQLLDLAHERVSVVHLAATRRVTPGGSRDVAGRPFILHVGQRGGYKNFLTLLTAYGTSHLCGEIDLVAFGGGRFTQVERDLMRRLNLTRNVRHVAGSDAVLGELYSAACLLAYPSLYEGFGIPLLEAMQLGCPVVCGRTSSLPEVAGNAAAFCDARSADDMRRAIETVVWSGSVRETLRRRGWERTQLFSWERCCRETLALYERLRKQ